MSTCLIAQATLLIDPLTGNFLVDPLTGTLITSTVYVLAPAQPPNVPLQSCAYVLVNGVEASALQQAVVPFDYALASAFWVFAFSTTIAFWYLSKNLGLILSAIKRG